MRKPLVLLLTLCMLTMGAGCSAHDTEETAAPTPDTSGDVVIVSPTAPYELDPVTPSIHAISLPTVQESATAEDGTVIFQCSYQDLEVCLDDPHIQSAVNEELVRHMEIFKEGADQIHSSAQQDYSAQAGWTPYFTELLYVPARIDSRVLSLQGTIQNYDGSAHPILSTMASTFDLTTGATLRLSDILVEDWSREEMIGKLQKSLEPSAPALYEDYEQKISDLFVGGISWFPDWCLTSEGLCFLFPPYTIAPADCGIIQAQIPYAELDGLLKQEYHPQPTVSNGSIYIDRYDPAYRERFTHVAQLTISDQGTAFLLYPDATVSDLRIEVGYLDQEGFQADYTAFAADPMCHGDALLIQADMSESLLRLTYRSDGQQVSALLHYAPETDQVTFQ